MSGRRTYATLVAGLFIIPLIAVASAVPITSPAGGASPAVAMLRGSVDIPAESPQRRVPVRSAAAAPALATPVHLAAGDGSAVQLLATSVRHARATLTTVIRESIPARWVAKGGPLSECAPLDRPSTFANGALPAAAVCRLPQDQHLLRVDAAFAFWQLNRAFRLHFGKRLCVSDSYRSLSAQQELYVLKPGLAAYPGTSNHGWGTAVDLCGGVEVYESAEHRWLRRHAQELGWGNPRWARLDGYRPEAWHWEYRPHGWSPPRKPSGLFGRALLS